MADPSKNRIRSLLRLGDHTFPHARKTQTDHRHNRTTPIRRHTSLLVLHAKHYPHTIDRRILRTSPHQHRHKDHRGNRTGLYSKLPEKKSCTATSRAKFTTRNCPLNGKGYPHGRPVARYVNPAPSHSALVLRFLVSKRTGSGFI